MVLPFNGSRFGNPNAYAKDHSILLYPSLTHSGCDAATLLNGIAIKCQQAIDRYEAFLWEPCLCFDRKGVLEKAV